ncbi:non-homologous end-joining DNA ligase [uncultured Jatrophihabitans sp.]|uniref:non-homologous end-joining DNA ligase n=1 Tax=uncultured Jatrophihabitans sp. TaxID=1610747 RepID=UPI0035CAE586
MLATATTALPVGAGWAYEFKWDGIRALVDVGDHGVRMTSRRGNDISAGYPELVAQAADVGDALLDGEIVAFVDGRPSFGQLQTRMHLRGAKDVARAAVDAPVTFVAFDLLRRFGVDLTTRPYTERRATLERFAAEYEGWTLSPSFDDGPATELVAREHGLEGVVAKRTDSNYHPGRRSEHWRKLRFVRSGDFSVIGWEGAAENPDTLSSLLLGIVTDDGLRFAGKVGSGLSGRTASTIQRRLTATTASAVPDVPRSIGGRQMHWVEPDLVVEVEFASWTGDHRLRHPVFRGVRDDKTVQEARG